MAVDYLQVESLTKSYGDNLLFEDLSFSVQNDRKIALVARNGAGKTSLLRIVVGEDTADSGLVTFRSDIRVAYLSQDPKMDAEKTVMEQIFSADTEELQIIRQYEEALENNDTTAIERLIGEMERLQLWDFEQQIKQILTKLRIHNYEQKIGHLSGGQRKRIALAHCLVNKPDLIILDEPTNHLDLDMIEWLEEYLNRTQAALLMVTHDRYFLDRICNEIIEIDNKTLFSYKGNYSEFLVKRDERIELQNLMAEKAKNLLRTEQDWMNRQPQARGTKAKYRIDNFYKLKDQAGSGYSSSQFDFEIQSRRLGSKILEMEAVNKNWGSLVTLKDFSYIFSRNEKIGIVGKHHHRCFRSRFWQN
jgi:ATP-binding cassette subfamily F protein uup